MSKTLKVTANHLKFASFVLRPVSEKAICFRSMYNTINIRFGFYDIQNNPGLGKGCQPQPLASADNPYLNFDYSGYRKNLIVIVYKLRCCGSCLLVLWFWPEWLTVISEVNN